MRRLSLLFIFLGCNIFAQEHQIDSLRGLLLSAKEDTARIDLCLGIGEQFYLQLPDSAVVYWEKGLKLSNLALQKYKDANAQRSVKLKKSQLLNNIGYILDNRGNVQRAIENYIASLKLLEEVDNKEGMGYAYNNLGVIYRRQNDHVNSEKYNMLALKVRTESGDKKGEAQSLTNIGQLYQMKGELEKAHDYYMRSIKIREKIGDMNGLAYSYQFMGNYFKAVKNYDGALAYHLRSLELRRKMNDERGIAYSLNSVGNIYYELKKYDLALKFARENYEISQKLNYPETIKISAELLKNIYSKTGEPMKALEMYDLFMAMKDSVNNQETRKSAYKQQINYEYEKKEFEIRAAQDKMNAIAEEEKQQHRIIIYSIATVLVMVLILALFILRGFRQKQKANLIITQQKLEVEQKHKEITDSINYAERIQKSFMATKKILDDNLKEYFVFFQPKDVVSGDFYWAGKLKNGSFALVTADSTGHGVPGAIMSILNISSIENAVKEESDPSKIFDHTRRTIIERLKRDGSEEGGKDGMDGTIICFDKGNKKLTYTAANNPVLVLRNTEVIELDCDKMPVGKHDKDQVPFKQLSIELEKGDVIYTLTDGMPDQFGGPKGKKFMYKHLKTLLTSISGLPMQTQKEHIAKTFNDWKGELEQVDDVCLIGVRV